MYDAKPSSIQSFLQWRWNEKSERLLPHKLKQVLQKLVSRDMRLQIFPKDFWVIDPTMEQVCESLSFSKIAKRLSEPILKNCPQCYSFNLRAKVFTHNLKHIETDGWNNYGGNIRIRRDHILEDAYNQIYIEKRNPLNLSV